MNANTAARLSERTLLCLVLALSWGTQACAAVRVKANAPAIAKEETTRKSSGVQQVHRAPAVLSLADAVFLGLRKNNSIRSAYVDRVAQKFDLLVAENQFSPRGSLNGEASHSVLGSLTTDTVSLGPSLNAVTPLGTSFNFVWDNTATRTGTASTIASAVSIGVVQPLLRGAGTDVNLAPVRSAELGEDVSRLHLRATVAQAITDIIAAYRELVRSRLSQKLAEDSAARAQALIDIDQNLILAGRMARMEIVQAQADLEGQKLLVLQSKSQVEAARLALAVLLDIELEAPIGVDEALNPMQSTIVLQQAITIALRRRPDYLAQKDAIEQARLGIVVAENQRLWDLSLVGSGRLGRQYSSAAFARSSRTTIADGSAGVSLSVPDQRSDHRTGSRSRLGVSARCHDSIGGRPTRLGAANQRFGQRHKPSLAAGGRRSTRRSSRGQRREYRTAET